LWALRRIVPPALLTASLAAFVLTGMLWDPDGPRRAPARVSEPVSRTTYYVDATIGGKPSDSKCITEGDNSRMKTAPCP
jgi:hypothetical protein